MPFTGHPKALRPLRFHTYTLFKPACQECSYDPYRPPYHLEKAHNYDPAFHKRSCNLYQWQHTLWGNRIYIYKVFSSKKCGPWKFDAEGV